MTDEEKTPEAEIDTKKASEAFEASKAKEAPEEMNIDNDTEEEKEDPSFFDRIFGTVRNRKKSKKSNTQRYIPISEIRNDTVIIKNGGLRAVLAVEPVNFNLKSETEQVGIITGYENFINTLTFPLQIIIRSTRVNIDPYIDQIRAKANMQDNELLKAHALSYALFVEKLVDVADIMQKRFYVVVPQDDSPAKHNPIETFLSWMHVDDSAAKITQRNKRFIERSNILRDRVNLVQSGLHNVGLISRRLSTHELIQVYYEMYNPSTSQEQQLSGDLFTEEFMV